MIVKIVSLSYLVKSLYNEKLSDDNLRTSKQSVKLTLANSLNGP